MTSLIVADYMTRAPHAIDADAPLEEAHRVMREFQIHHLPVLTNGKLVGMLSMEDLHLIETIKDVDVTEVRIAEAMADDPYTVTPATSLRVAAQEMWRHGQGSAVVLDDAKVVGVLTVTDALRALSDVLA